MSENPLDRQEGGDHYSTMAIGPAEITTRNNLTWLEGNIIKYILRHRKKGGRRDIHKLIHCAQLILQLSYGDIDGSDTET